LRGLAGLSLVFSLVRDFTESGLQVDGAEFYQAGLANEQHHAAMPGRISLYHNSN
jgi:hypothetical protein